MPLAALAEQEQSLIMSSTTERRKGCCTDFCSTHGYTFIGILVLLGVPLTAYGIFELCNSVLTGHDSLSQPSAFNWSYSQEALDGKTDADWPGYLCANGIRQSPIDIPTRQFLPELAPDVSPLSIRNLRSPTNVTVVNTKSTVELDVPPHAMIKLSGGVLSGEYVLQKIIIHWSLNDYAGSEHTIGGRAYPVELQFLFAKVGYTRSALVRQSDGFVGLSVFGRLDYQQTGRRGPPAMDAMIRAFARIRRNEQRTYAILSLSYLLPEDYQSYYTYLGSSTRPKCREHTRWLVMKNPIIINQIWLSSIRRLTGLDGRNIQANSRPLQPLNGRVVEYKNSPVTPAPARRFMPRGMGGGRRLQRGRRRNWRRRPQAQPLPLRIGNIRATHHLFV